ncbi:flagellar basal-body MS-ring/collar protein FliF [Ruixingdingia sedimenti]|uniref:Flagellar M-ring protein n=1 Tax=Ruixingdingia sedimenti TaxID=3073604 RepID=A0ABU1F772_9RHOB|nr:flagellar basal-body MS-ring/collar protein FliF [Xinfangfangia sp. LG-4]MDR5652725.1 flagellar basal-body MS-ring/collar protein FliF [Xinfangfangia sp. LG-4]
MGQRVRRPGGNRLEQLLSLWSGLSTRRRALVAGATVAVFVAVLALARMGSAPQMALLYAGLDPAAAGEVVTALEQRGARFEVRGDSIWVDRAGRDQLRMALAGEGMPALGSRGYELLDSLSGFGTTSQMFDAAYLRAKEGELARTALALPGVRSARVHVAVPGAQPFRRVQRATASVTVTTDRGALPAEQARALRYLVASAVPGLSPEDVAVIDSQGGLVAAEDAANAPARAAGDRAEELRQRVERLLAARVGAGRALVEVSVDLVTERESIVEKRFDPQSRVAISTETEERSDNSSEAGSNGVGVASNLPEGDAAEGRNTSSRTSETRERVNYEVSEVAREVERAPGAVRRLSVAVLVDGLRAEDGTWQARSEAELADLRELVTSAVGFDAERGDVITIKSLEFEPITPMGTLAEAGMFAGLDMMTLIQMAVAALVALALGIFVIRPVLTSARLPVMPAPAALPPPDGARVLDGVIDDGEEPPRLSVIPHKADPGDDPPPDPVERLRRLIAERQAESVEILRGWMDDREEAR